MQKRRIIELSISGVLIFVLLVTIVTVAGRKKSLQSQGTKRKGADLANDRASVKGPLAQGSAIGRGSQGRPGILYKRLEEKTKDLELKRDPFMPRPAISTEASLGDLRLFGIVWDKEGPYAIINEIIVKIGDSIAGKIVVDIKQDEVALSDGTEYFKLRLGK